MISATSINSSFNSIAPDSSRVMSRRLETNRFSRSASSCRVREQLFALGCAVFLREAAQARHGADDRGERRSQIVRDRGQQRRAQPLGLGQHAGLVEPLGERNALDRDRRLIAQARRAAAARPASATVPACRGRSRSRRPGRCRCAAAGTAACRPATCRRRARRGGCAPSVQRAAAISASSSRSSGG